MEQLNESPLTEFIFKLCLLEAVKCNVRKDSIGLAWLEELMATMVNRWAELGKNDL